MGETKPRTCGQCSHLEPGALWGILTCYARDEGTIYPVATSDTAERCPKFELKPATAGRGKH